MGKFVGDPIFKVVFNGITQPLMCSILAFAQGLGSLS